MNPDADDQRYGEFLALSYFYHTGPIDIFSFVMSTEEAAKSICFGELDWDRFEAIDFLEACAEDAKLNFGRIGWEGDVRAGPYFFGIPNSGAFNITPGVIIKQSNNGSTFTASPLRLPHLEDHSYQWIDYDGTIHDR